MTIGPGTRIGPYQLSALIGEGGMGQVWRAYHTALKREDALKVLPAGFATDAERVARFAREAQILASLNHPHIAHIYGVERTEDVQALVMELVEGPTLAARIAAGPVPTAETLSIAKQIAEALEAAHERGIVHRDLKPANVKVRPDGTVKVLDFGLARSIESVAAISPSVSTSPTVTSPAMTQAGVIMGTAAYMSPEQARGLQADHRSDIFSFGCVLYEMLTGRRPFDGRDVGESLAFVITREPDLGLIPRPVRTLVARCLTKDRQQRLQAIGEARIALHALLSGQDADQALADTDGGPRRRVSAALIAGTVLAALVLSLFALWRLKPTSESAGVVTRFVLSSPAGLAPRGFGTGRHALAISPQGTHVVYLSNNHLHARAMDQLADGVRLRGTEGAREPVFSPNGQWIAFHQDRELRRVSLNGGVPVALTQAEQPIGISWQNDGTVLYGQRDGVWRVRDSGGAPERLIALDTGESAHGPQSLPDGQWLLFTLKPSGVESWDDAQIVAQSLATSERVVLVDRGRDARYVAGTKHLVYGLEGVLLATPFDVRTRRVTGGRVPVVEGVMDADTRTGAMQFSVSDNGTLVYLAAGVDARATLTWVTQEGAHERLPIAPAQFFAPRVSPDGTRLAVEIAERDGTDIHIYDIGRKALAQLTAKPLRGSHPLWMPDGQRVAFYSADDGGGLFVKSIDGSERVERLTHSSSEQIPSSWSSDGRTLLLEQREHDPATRAVRVGVYSMRLGQAPTKVLDTRTGEGQPVLSPDGRWLAYVSRESSRDSPGVHVRPFPDVQRARWSVSTRGGHSPLWSRDGKHLFFISGGQAMMVAIDADSDFRAGAPKQLFALPPFYSSIPAFGWQWDIASDDRLLVVEPGVDTSSAEPTAEPTRLIAVLNWFEELRRRVSSN